MLCFVETVRWQGRHAGEGSGAEGNQQQKTAAKAAGGRGQDEGADAEGDVDLPDKLPAGRSDAHPCDGGNTRGFSLCIASLVRKARFQAEGAAAQVQNAVLVIGDKARVDLVTACRDARSQFR